MAVTFPSQTLRLPRHVHVLVVEDNPDGREALRVLLSMMGYEVEVAADGAEGVRLGISEHPDVAIVDIGLPKLNGYQVAQRLREELGQDITLVAYTAYEENGLDSPTNGTDFDAWLRKPVDLAELMPWLVRKQPG